MPSYKTTYIEKGTDAERITEIFGALLHQLNYIMNNLDSRNVRRINTNSTSIRSADGSTEIDGSQLIMYDGDGVKRVSMGKNSNGVFEFALYDARGRETLRFDAVTGNAAFSGDITASHITGSDITGSNIRVETDVHVGDNIYLGTDYDESGTKMIQFFDDETDDSKKGKIITVKSPSNGLTELRIVADRIVLSTASGVENGGGQRYVTADGMPRAVEIDGVPHTLTILEV